MNALTAGFLAFVVTCGAGIGLAIVSPPRRCAAITACVGSLGALILTGLGGFALLVERPLTTALWTIPPFGSVSVHYDPLSGLFLLVTGLVFLAASVYAAGALAELPGCYSLRAYIIMYFALFFSIAWVLVAHDVFSFLVAWEIMSILCYVLVGFEHERTANSKAAYLMLAAGEAGALAALLGLLVLAAGANSLDFTQLKASATTLGPGTRWAVFLLTFFGFAVKAGLMPVNFWLPRAYTAAPAAFVPVLAGATLNLGLYGILRVNADLLPATLAGPGLVALSVGAISALLGILYATTSNDLKTLLAHSSIENAGIITVGFGAGFVFTAAGKPVLAAIAFLVALYHLVNHSLFKTLLFIGAGAVDACAGTRDLDLLGGLIRRMPVTALAFLAGALAIAGLPPFNGFVSEWLTLQTLLRSAELSSGGVKIAFALCGAGLALTAALAVTCFVKMFAMGFLGIARSDRAERAMEAKSSARASMMFLAVLCLVLGVLPTYVIAGLDHAAKPLAHASGSAALVPPFFSGSPGHETLPAAFVDEFRDLGAQTGQSLAPGPGLVIMHRGGTSNPVVFAAAPTYLVLVLLGLLAIVFLVVRITTARQRVPVRRTCWDGGIRRLLPEMTYTATGFSNPVRVIFQAIFHPTIVEDTQETVAEHFRTAIRRQFESVHVTDRFMLGPVREATLWIARTLARMHQGRLNVYVAYLLGTLIVILVWNLLR